MADSELFEINTPDRIDILVSQIQLKTDNLEHLLERYRQMRPDKCSIASLNDKLAQVHQQFEAASVAHAELCALVPISARPKVKYFAENQWKTFQFNFDTLDELLGDKVEVLYKAREADAAGRHREASLRTSTPERHNDTLNHSHYHPVRLPQLTITPFSGALEEWQNFNDSFMSAVHNHPSLSPVEKMQHLKNSLQGEAAKLICALPTTNANYPIALNALKERYENERVQVNNLLNKLTTLQVATMDNVTKLQNLRDTFKMTIDSLESLGRDTAASAYILIHNVYQKLSHPLQREWENVMKGRKQCPELQQFMQFLDEQVNVLVNLSVNREVKKDNSPSGSNNQRQRALTTSVKRKCDLCDENHALYACPKFIAMNVDQRFAIKKSKRLCTNCLSKEHSINDCSSKATCKKCSKKHNTLLHFEKYKSRKNTKVKSDLTDKEEEKTSDASKAIGLRASLNAEVLIATVLVTITAPNGQFATVRAMLDSGSESTFVRGELVQALKLPRDRVEVNISGLENVHTGMAKYVTQFQMTAARTLAPNYTVNAYVLNSITDYPPKKFKPMEYAELQHLTLADPEPYKQLPIDILLGADLINQFVKDGIKRLKGTDVIAQNTTLGWVLQGPHVPRKEKIVRVRHATTDLVHAIERFWETEAVPETKPLSKEDELAEAIFESTTTREPDGRYVVRLPFLSPEEPTLLGESRSMAIAYWRRVANSLDKQPKVREMYDNFMQEFIDLGHMSLIPDNDQEAKNYVYLPHHGVYRKDSETTPLRVVVNASSRTRSGKSLNDTLCTGPKLQNDICDVIMIWRFFRFVLAADIAKMFRQIKVHEDDRKYQCLLWNKADDPVVKGYKLNTVTYGTKPAPYLANKIIKTVIEDHGKEFPLAKQVLDKQTYVDDVHMGAHTKEEAIILRDQVDQILKRGKLELRKWVSNCPELLPVKNETSDKLLLQPEDHLKKILGIQWSAKEDVFMISTSNFKPEITKRTILSQTASLFDPLGFLSPYIVRAKILMQSLWLIEAGWDDELPESVQQEWIQISSELKQLHQLKIPRYVGRDDQPKRVRLVGFADASSRAYAAAVYVYQDYENEETKSELLIAKSRIAPVKTMSIPRLELSAAALLAELMARVKSVLTVQIDEVICYTDSRIVLSWLEKHASTWKVFVANKVASIQTTLPNVKWRHVTTKQNPADLNSRGLSVEEIINSDLWWHGPKLPDGDTADITPEEQDLIKEQTLLEQRSKAILHQVVEQRLPFYLTRYSRWDKLLRALAYWAKFVQKVRERIQKRKTAPEADASQPSVPNTEEAYLFLSRDLIKRAELFIFRELQQLYYADEITACKQKVSVGKKSALYQLNPMLDNNGILRVGGRLEFAENLTEDEKHPIILPQCRVTRVLAYHCHERVLHGGTLATLTLLRQRFWIIHARNLVKLVVSKCVICARNKGKLEQQKMAPLPAKRCSSGDRPFAHVGVDYAGPYMMRNASGRGYKAHKVWISVFVCFATRAIHLEIVDSYTTKSFLAALDCFVARRGLPNTIYSDCATYYQGADKELKKAYKTITEDPDVSNKLATLGIEWIFIPPKAPHQGGLWEAAVKAVKHHLHRIMGDFKPTWEEMRTLVCRIEACLNSRPLTQVTDDHTDGPALTDGHFLVGTPLLQVPEVNLLDLNQNLLNRWQQVSRMVQTFWNRWRTEYIQQLQKRTKWQEESPNLQVGDIVIVREPMSKPGHWKLAQVIEAEPGRDGLVRQVKIKTESTTLVRPITELCKLPVDQKAKLALHAKFHAQTFCSQ